MSGSSKLTPEQQKFYAARLGDRYVAVQEQPLRPSRALRRARKGKRQAGRITAADVAVANAQSELFTKLTDHALTRGI